MSVRQPNMFFDKLNSLLQFAQIVFSLATLVLLFTPEILPGTGPDIQIKPGPITTIISPQATNAGWHVTYQGETIDRLFEVSFIIENAGDEPLRQEDVLQPLGIEIPALVTCHEPACQVIGSDGSFMQSQTDEPCSCTEGYPSQVTLSPSLVLQPKETICVSALLSAQSIDLDDSILTVIGRVAEDTDLTKAESGSPALTKVLLFCAIVIGVFSLALIPRGRSS